MIKLSENIKKLRSERGVKQDVLAGYLNVTPQAVSRWESGACYPDIQLLPSIASFFGISVDDLLGYNPTEGEQSKLIQNISEMLKTAPPEKTLEACRDALLKYPANYYLTLLTATSVFLCQQVIKDRESDEYQKYSDEGIALCERVLRDCGPNIEAADTIRSSARMLNVMFLKSQKKYDEAIRNAATMPSFVSSLEFLLLQLLEPEAKQRLIRTSVLPSLIALCKLSLVSSVYTREESHSLSKLTLDECRRIIAVYDALYDLPEVFDGDKMKKASSYYAFIHLRWAKLLYDANDNSAALAHLRIVADCLPHIEPAPGNTGLRAVFIGDDDMAEIAGSEKMTAAGMFCSLYFDRGAFKELESDPEYQEIAAELRKYV